MTDSGLDQLSGKGYRIPMREVIDWECVGGPYDGSLLPGYGQQAVVKLFERSPISYTYRRDCDETGYFWRFAGIVDAVAA